MKSIQLILIASVMFLCSCAQGEFSPGPQDPIGPQGDQGPEGPIGPSSSDAIVIDDSGQLVNKEYTMDAFDEIEINGLDVTIKQGDSHQVTLNVEKNLYDYIFVDQEGTKLKIGIDPSNTYNMEKITKNAEITTPGLISLVVDGIGKVNIDGFKSEGDLSLRVGGVSELLGNIETGDVQLNVSSVNSVILNGSAREMTIEAQGPCEIDLSGMKIENLEVNADGLCQVTHPTSD